MEVALSPVAAWSYGLACIGFAALAAHLALGLRGGIYGAALLAAVALSGVWTLLGWVFATGPDPRFFSAAGIADVLRIGAWYTFLLLLIHRLHLPGESSPVRWLAIVAAVLVLTGLAAHSMDLLQRPWVDPAWLGLLASLGLAIFGLVLVETLLRNQPADARWNIKPVCIGLVAVFIFDIYVYADGLLFSRIDADAFSVRGFVHALVIPLVAVTAARSRDWKSRIALSRRLVFHSAAIAASGVYLLFVAGVGYYVRFFGGDWGRAFQVAVLFAGLLLLGIALQSGSMRARLKVLINKHFFRYRYDYREEWLRFTRTLSACDGQRALGEQIVRGLADMVESPSGALWVKDASGRRYVQGARWNMPASDAGEDADSPLVHFLAESGWVINLEEFRSFPGRYGDLQLPVWLSTAPHAWLVVPLATGDELVGFVVLATARARVDVNWEVNDLFKTAGRQAASFLMQVKATEALLETRKFDAFNRMSAFVVHDLKNIVAQLSLMLKNAERHKDNPEFQKDMLMTVAHATDRVKQLLMQLREGTTPVDAPRGVDLAEVIRRIQQAKRGLEPVPELQLEERLAARGHEDRIERVIGHLVQNALDATDRTGRVWVRLERQGEHAMIEIGDTGHGMTPEFLRERLFKPFQTTKQSGMGIGAYESYQYVQELGGRILVESTPGTGTRIRILLPLFEGKGIAERSTQEAAA